MMNKKLVKKMIEREQEIATREYEEQLRRNNLEEEKEEWFPCPAGGLVCQTTCFYCQTRECEEP